MMCFALALCMAFNGGIALIVRGVRRRWARGRPRTPAWSSHHRLWLGLGRACLFCTWVIIRWDSQPPPARRCCLSRLCLECRWAAPHLGRQCSSGA
jgi:hypothetical protein